MPWRTALQSSAGVGSGLGGREKPLTPPSAAGSSAHRSTLPLGLVLEDPPTKTVDRCGSHQAACRSSCRSAHRINLWPCVNKPSPFGLRWLKRAYFMFTSQVSPQACFTVISVGTAFVRRGIEKIDSANRQIDAGIASRIQSSFLMVIRWCVPICHGID